jgi:hypothetical protein
VLEHYIETARERDAETVNVLVSDVNKALGLNQAWPNICQAIIGNKFLKMADVEPPEQIGANQSSATVFQFRLSQAGSNHDSASRGEAAQTKGPERQPEAERYMVGRKNSINRRIEPTLRPAQVSSERGRCRAALRVAESRPSVWYTSWTAVADNNEGQEIKCERQHP